MARQLFSLVLVVALLVASSSAQSCLGTPPVSGLLASGTPCDGSIPCAKGLACDLTSTCSQVKVGDSCAGDDTSCPAQSSCVGPATKRVCVANANVGAACTSDSTNGDALCYSIYGCSLGGKCLGGLGDGCSTDADCIDGLTGKCTNGVCKQLCGTSSCEINQYCNIDTCDALPTSGDCLLGACAPGYQCVNTDLTGLTTHCVKSYSVATAGFCNTGSECASGLCWRNKCQANSPDSCEWNPSNRLATGCALGDVCSCGNGYLTNGYGTCSADKCWDSFWAFITCMMTNCQIDPTFSYTDYLSAPNLCAFKSCNTQYTAYDSCDSGHALYTLFVQV